MSESKQSVEKLKIAQEYMREHLPFYLNRDFTACYAHKLFEFQKQFLLNRKRLSFLTAANQIGKSSVQIIKCINMAVRQDLWPFWFPKRKPKTFFYLYPDSKTASVEVSSKWTTYLPKGPMKADPRFGWKINYGEKGQVDSIEFTGTGVTVFFRTYSAQAKFLQAATLDAVFLDEECPESHYNELMVRTQSSAAQGAGYVSMVFTATLGSEYLYKTMEMQGTSQEKFPDAWKMQVSLFDCIYYADGTPSEIWTEDYINREVIPTYSDQREVERRVFGKFVRSAGLLFQEFQKAKNLERVGETDTTGWRSYVGIDFGTGGDFGHSSAIVQVKVDPTFSKARVVYVWTSEKRRMTQSDLLMKYKDLAERIGPHQAFADWGAVDFFTLAAREGIRIEKAEKSHEIGIPLINSLLKSGQLKIVMGNGDHAEQLVMELGSVSDEKAKRHRTDDVTDALRYAISLCPLRLTGLKVKEEKKQEDYLKMNPRQAFYKGLDRSGDPMREPDDEYAFDLDEAINEFEDLL